MAFDTQFSSKFYLHLFTDFTLFLRIILIFADIWVLPFELK